MNITPRQILFANLIAISTLLLGCSKQNEADNATPPAPATKASESVVSDAQKAVANAADQAKDATQKLAADAQKQASDAAAATQKQAADLVAAAQKKAADAAAAAQTQAQGFIDQAKALVAEKKYPEALSVLQQKLGGLQLTAEQQKLVASLKEQIQKALTAVSADPTKSGVQKLLGK